MQVVKKTLQLGGRGDEIRIVPIGDIHLGASTCDEGLLKGVVADIAADPAAHWIYMGDGCNYINPSDPRFQASELAKWIKARDLGDLVAAQTSRLLSLLSPIAGKCLAAVQGNHELTVEKHYERDIFSDIVTAIKREGNMPPDSKLSVGYTGWLQLSFRRGKDDRGSGRQLNISLHHGFGGSGNAGAKFNNMQRWLWTHNADVAIFGHTHGTGVQKEAVETINTAGRVETSIRFGAHSGTFLKGTGRSESTYAERRGYSPLPLGGVDIRVRPYQASRIRIICN